MSNPASGIGYFLDGFRLIFKPGLKRFVIIPFIINVIVFIGLFFLLRHFFAEFNHWFIHYLPSWLHWLAKILWLVFFMSFFIIFIYAFVTIGNFISAPFNSFLAEQAELYLRGKIPEARTLGENIKDIPRIMGRQLGIVAYYLLRALLILLLFFFIPGVQPLVAIIWFLFNAWYLTLTYIDYPSDNHRVPIKDVRAWLKKRPWTTFGFGMSVLVASMIPVINFFTIPAAVVGATKFWLEESSL